MTETTIPQRTDRNQPETRGWLNRNVFAFALTSLLGDFCHEMATAILPQFMQAIGASAAALGFIEGVADALSSFAKLGAGYCSDKTGHRKRWAVAGYALTGVSKAIFAFAFAWPLILVGRVLGWFGRGIRGPARDAMLAASVETAQRGKAFGFHRASDTLGAVLGPLAAYWLLGFLSQRPGLLKLLGDWLPSLAGAPGPELRIIFLLTLIPGLLSVASMAFLVTERGRPGNNRSGFQASLRAMPQSYRSFLLAVGLFGLADCAPTLMILRSTTILGPRLGVLEAARIAALLYLLRNIVYAVACFPIGALSDRFSRSRYLAVGYGVAVAAFVGFAVAFDSLWWLGACFSLAGVFIAWEDTVERAAVRDYVAEPLAGTAFGLLGVVNGIGDFGSSFMVGFLWTQWSATWGFGYAVLVGLVGTIAMVRVRGPGITEH